MMVLSSVIYDVNLKNMSSVRNWLERHTWLYIVELMNLFALIGKILVSKKVKVQLKCCMQGAVCREPNDSKRIHYHMCITFDRNQRWGCSKQHLLGAHEISVHFSEKHAIYIALYRYVCKWDRNVLLSPDHPDLDLTVSPRTRRASKEV